MNNMNKRLNYFNNGAVKGKVKKRIIKDSIAFFVLILAVSLPNSTILQAQGTYGVSPEDMQKAIQAKDQPERSAEKPVQAEKTDKGSVANPVTEKTSNGMGAVNNPMMQAAPSSSNAGQPGKMENDSANTGRAIQKEPTSDIAPKNNASPKEFIEEPPSGNANKSPAPPQATTPDSKTSKEPEKPIDTYIRGY